jgi:hypothetical protein
MVDCYLKSKGSARVLEGKKDKVHRNRDLKILPVFFKVHLYLNL